MMGEMLEGFYKKTGKFLYFDDMSDFLELAWLEKRKRFSCKY